MSHKLISDFYEKFIVMLLQYDFVHILITYSK